MTNNPRSPNHVLASLSAADYEEVSPSLRLDELAAGSVIVEAEGEISRVYFPHSAIISLVVRLDNGESVEAAMVGRDGAFGAGTALDGRIALNTAIVQRPGLSSTIEVAELREAAGKSEPFRALLMRHEQVVLAQALQTAGCNASHTLQSRLSRWLLRARDLAGSDKLSFTQEFLGQMLGAQRNSISVVANTLQQAGLIRYRRGEITIVDLNGLQDSSCECYAKVKRLYSNLVLK